MIKAELATFGGGCFWCMVQPFEKTHGVTHVISGYAGGTADNLTYEDYAQKILRIMQKGLRYLKKLSK